MTINRKTEIYKALEQVMDPEIPVLNVLDLGMITHVEITGNGAVLISMIPTFSACPAVEMIRNNIRRHGGKRAGRQRDRGDRQKRELEQQPHGGKRERKAEELRDSAAADP